MSFVILIRLQLELVDHWLHWIRLIHLTWTWLNWQLFFNMSIQFIHSFFFVIYLVWLTTLNFAAVWLMATPTRALRMNPHWAEEILSVRKDLELKKSEFLWFRLRVLNLICPQFGLSDSDADWWLFLLVGQRSSAESDMKVNIIFIIFIHY